MPTKRLDDNFALNSLKVRHWWALETERGSAALVWATDGHAYYQAPSGHISCAPELELLDEVYVSSSRLQTEILQTVCRETTAPDEQEWRLRWTFWRDLDLRRVRRKTLEFNVPHQYNGKTAYYRSQLRIDTAGCQLWQRGANLGRSYQQRSWLSLADTFFSGTTVKQLPLTFRTELRETIYSFLSPATTLRIEDGLPLIDYSKITKTSWEWHPGDQDRDNGAFLIIDGSTASLGGWEGHIKNAGGHDYPIEDLLSSSRMRYWRAVPQAFLEEAQNLVLSARIDG